MVHSITIQPNTNTLNLSDYFHAVNKDLAPESALEFDLSEIFEGGYPEIREMLQDENLPETRRLGFTNRNELLMNTDSCLFSFSIIFNGEEYKILRNFLLEPVVPNGYSIRI